MEAGPPTAPAALALLADRHRFWFHRCTMAAAWDVVEAASGVVTVLLPPGETLHEHDGIAAWPGGSGAGRFTVVSAPLEAGGGDELLAAERAGGDVAVEIDERSSRGGLAVRRLRYRTRRHEPRVILDSGAGGPVHGGDEDAEYLSDFLLITAGPTLVRAGYAVRTDGPASLREALGEIMRRLRVGDER
jgi:hypothetical protein